MSYCRFCSEDHEIYGIHIPKSDVYVFESEFGCECCGCILNDGKSQFMTTLEMVDHMKEHIAAGHAVPDHVIPELMEEANAFDNYCCRKHEK